ncbi:MAG: hypothetical protein ACK5XV_06840 [Flavobacteriales bacterium]
MALRNVSRIALAYGLVMAVCGIILLTSHASSDFDDLTGTIYCAVLLFGGLAQAYYAMSSLRKLHLPVYESMGTLDNELLFEAGGQQIYRHSWLLISLAVVATMLELLLAYLAVLSLRRIPGMLSDPDASTMVVGILYALSLLGAVPAILFNLRTWNMQRVLP